MEDSKAYISFDPGLRTGWATFNSEGKGTGCGIINDGIYGVTNWLIELKSQISSNKISRPKRFIVETYRIKNFKHPHHLSTVPTIRIIGAIQSFAYGNGIRWTEQESYVMKEGFKWAGVPIPKGHIRDDKAAMAHGVYWLYKNGLWEIEL